MSNSTTQFVPRYTNTLTTVRFYQIGYPITFFLGFLGNISSLLTFSQLTLRKVSTGCLFIMLAISDMLFLLVCIIDFIEFGLNVKFFPSNVYDQLCRFRTFVMSTTQLASSWILVMISLDRWIRTRFPFKSPAICKPKNTFIAVFILLIIDIGLHSHILTPLFGRLVAGFASGACGPYLFIANRYLTFYYRQWSIIQIFTTCLIPAFLMLIALIDIQMNIYLRKKTLIQPIHSNITNQRQGHIQKQMFILMFASICIFFLTNLPLNLYKIISAQTNNVHMIAVQATTILAILGWIQSLNQAINFYIHCLTSKLFRREFYEKLMTCFHRHSTRVDITNTMAQRFTNQRSKINQQKIIYHITAVSKRECFT